MPRGYFKRKKAKVSVHIGLEEAEKATLVAMAKKSKTSLTLIIRNGLKKLGWI